MKCRYWPTFVLVATTVFAAARINLAQENSTPSDVKPAQAGSPAAHPTEKSDRDRSNADRNRPNRSSNNENRNVVRNEERAEGRTATNRRDSRVDQQIAACLLQKNQAEVELGKMAADRASDKDVKEFAEHMVKDHSRVAEKLERLVGSNEPNDRRSKIDRQIGERCLANLKKELSDKSDHEFDAAYIGTQIGGHMEMVAALDVLSEETSGELRDVVKDAQPTVEKHLSRAKEIMKSLDKSGGHHEAARDRSQSSR